ncbi:hypothetical protein DUNSADRAFT_7057 [Dunaliella salina]|uniref:Uncharacterized protein n=1 Tax=Dunaliella salina TaxID=3046 RepID=A0ABQ7H6L7_DUNSA|nr:hypothetical protein DUNSADRAFT_7057 [Dunaliella salina]|eukprot:KAF5842448.1 hypothetical protein DUNSADRAFT_7057 [Dunaliella salina]
MHKSNSAATFSPFRDLCNWGADLFASDQRLFRSTSNLQPAKPAPGHGPVQEKQGVTPSALGSSPDGVPPIQVQDDEVIALAGSSRTGSSCSAICHLQTSDGSGGGKGGQLSGRQGKAYLLEPLVCSTLNGGNKLEAQSHLQHQQQQQRLQQQQQQQQQQPHASPSSSDHGGSKASSSTFNLPSPPSPSSCTQHRPSMHTTFLSATQHPPSVHTTHQPPNAHQSGQPSVRCGPGRAASVHGGGLVDLKYRPPQKFASFNHNLQSGRLEDQFVRSSRELDINSENCSEEGNSSDDAAEEKATWELLSRRSSAEQAACMQRRSVEHQISHRRKLSSASSLPAMMTASSYDLSELASVAAADSAPSVVQEELQQMQRQQALTSDGQSTTTESQPR